MIIKRKKKGAAEIPTASTSDIAFLLIIFFMATTKFDVKEGLSLVLPPAAKETTQIVKLTEKEMTRVIINPGSEIVFNDTSLGVFNQAVVDAKIKEKLALNSTMIFTIKTARDASYNDMVRVLDRLKKNGAEKISLSTN